MKMLRRMLGKDNRGLSMIELILAVAILATISTAIGGAMAVSANSYRRGTVETGLQQESQYTAGVIENLIVDATNTVDFSSSSKTLEIVNTDFTHVISMVSAAAGNELRYTKKDTSTGAIVSEGNNVLLASNVTDFYVDTSNFNKSRNAQVTIKMAKEGRDISTVYNITSRNHPSSSMVVAPPTKTVTITGDSMVTLEPIQSYDLNCKVVAAGGASRAVNVSVSGATDPMHTTASWSDDKLTVNIGKDERSSQFNVRVSSADSSAVSTPHDVTVNVRRVIDFAKDKTAYPDTPPAVKFQLISGTDYKKDAIYEVTAVPYGTNLDKVFGAAYDNDYVNPYGATWELQMTSSDLAVKIDEEEDNNPYIRIKLERSMLADDKITVTATAKHPRGEVNGIKTNKTQQPYDDVKVTVELKKGRTIVDAGILRGDESHEIPDLNWSSIMPGGVEKVCRMMRWAPVKTDDDNNIVAQIGAWSPWKEAIDHSTPGFIKLNKDELILNPNYDYLLEIVCKAVNGDHSVVYWPTPTTPEDEYTVRVLIPAVSVYLDSYWMNGSGYWDGVNNVWVNIPGRTVNFPVSTSEVSYGDRFTLKKGDNTYINFSTNAAHATKFLREYMYVSVYKQTTSGWQRKDYSQGGGEMGGDRITGGFYVKADEPGIYILVLDWKNNWTGDPDYTSVCSNDEHYPENYDPSSIPPTSGKGVFYFEVVE